MGRTNHVTNKCWWKCRENRNAGFSGANFAPRNTKLGKKCVLRTGIIRGRKMRPFRRQERGKEKIARLRGDHLSLFLEISRGDMYDICRSFNHSPPHPCTLFDPVHPGHARTSSHNIKKMVAQPHHLQFFKRNTNLVLIEFECRVESELRYLHDSFVKY